MHLRRVGVGRENLDAARYAVGWVEHTLVLRHRERRMPQPGDADVRVHHLAADEAGRVYVPSDGIGCRASHQAGPEHRVGGAVNEFVSGPVGLGVVSREPVVSVINVQLTSQRRLGVHPHLAQQPIVGAAIVGIEPLARVHGLGPGIHRLAKARHKVVRPLRPLGIRLEGEQLLHVGEAARVLSAWPRGSYRVDAQPVFAVQSRGAVQNQRPVRVVVHHIETKPCALAWRQTKRGDHAGKVAPGAVVTVHHDVPRIREGHAVSSRQIQSLGIDRARNPVVKVLPLDGVQLPQEPSHVQFP